MSKTSDQPPSYGVNSGPDTQSYAPPTSPPPTHQQSAYQQTGYSQNPNDMRNQNATPQFEGQNPNYYQQQPGMNYSNDPNTVWGPNGPGVASQGLPYQNQYGPGSAPPMNYAAQPGYYQDRGYYDNRYGGGAGVGAAEGCCAALACCCCLDLLL